MADENFVFALFGRRGWSRISNLAATLELVRRNGGLQQRLSFDARRACESSRRRARCIHIVSHRQWWIRNLARAAWPKCGLGLIRQHLRHRIIAERISRRWLNRCRNTGCRICWSRGYGRHHILSWLGDLRVRPLATAGRPFTPLRGFIAVLLLFWAARALEDCVFAKTPIVRLANIRRTRLFIGSLGTNTLAQAATRNCRTGRRDEKYCVPP